jgi:hypothetical protein
MEVLAEPGGLRGHQRRAALARRATHRADVDGDGRADRVTVRWAALADPTVPLGRLVLAVRTATGATDSWSARASYVPTRERADGTVGLPWVGVGDVDGLPGDELTLPTSMGASYVFEHVLAWRAGGLVVLPPPPPTYSWAQGGSVGTGESDWGCRDGRLVTFRAIPTRPPPDRYVVGYRTVTTEWMWSGGWHAVSVERGSTRGGHRPEIEDCWRNRDGEWW